MVLNTRNERADLVAWRELFMRRIQEIKKMSQTGKSSTGWNFAECRPQNQEAVGWLGSIAKFPSFYCWLWKRWLHEGFDGKKEASNNCRLYHWKWADSRSSLDVFHPVENKKGRKTWFSIYWNCSDPGRNSDPSSN